MFKPRYFYMLSFIMLSACAASLPKSTESSVETTLSAAKTEMSDAATANAASDAMPASESATDSTMGGSYEPKVGAKFHNSSSRNGDSVWEYKGVVGGVRVLERIKGRHVGDVAKYTMGWDQVAFESDTFTDQTYRPTLRGYSLPLVPGTTFSHTYQDNRTRTGSARTNTINCRIRDHEELVVAGLAERVKAAELDCTFDSDASGRAYAFRELRDADSGLFLSFESWRTSNPNRKDFSRTTRIEP